MGTYRTAWPCCGDTTETEAWEPCECPFCEVHRLRGEVERLRAMIASASAVLYDAPELNPSNYDHEDVCRLNAAACEAYVILAPPNTPRV